MPESRASLLRNSSSAQTRSAFSFTASVVSKENDEIARHGARLIADGREIGCKKRFFRAAIAQNGPRVVFQRNGLACEYAAVDYLGRLPYLAPVLTAGSAEGTRMLRPHERPVAVVID
jgi:hypothetical protein